MALPGRRVERVGSDGPDHDTQVGRREVVRLRVGHGRVRVRERGRDRLGRRPLARQMDFGHGAAPIRRVGPVRSYMGHEGTGRDLSFAVAGGGRARPAFESGINEPGNVRV